MVKRSAKPRRGGTAVDQLQAALTRSLKDSITEAVSSVCGSFQQAVDEQAAAGASSAEDSGGYDVYYSNCRRLVDYIQQNMEASPGFGEQMDRIILACHSGATERVLSSVVTKQLWFHARGDAPSHADKRETRSGRQNSSSGGDRARSAAKKKVKRDVSSRIATRAATDSPAAHTRSASGSKRTATRGSTLDAQPVKRPRRATRKVIHDTSEEEEEEEEEVKTEKPRRGGKKQEEDDDELLSFKDAIGELCYPDRRSPSETKFFKERLCKSIQFVDALLCKPPKGKVCVRGCKKIRAQMCSSSTPCKNKMCRIWHDVEAHTDRCQNPQCEFKNRILLRETMHKVEIKEQQIAELKTELKGKQVGLKEAADADKEELESDIASLEHDIEECEEELSVLEGTKKTFWSNLNEIGIEVRDDVVDNFPDFATHYEEKKVPRKARKAIAADTPHLSSASSRSSRAAARHVGAGPHGSHADDEEEADDADVESVGDNIPRRTARRSTSSGPYSAPPHHESDEETKGGDEEASQNGDEVPPPDEPPLPPVGPPPFRQNPELDREFAISASGYSIHPPADDLEAPAVAMGNEPINHAESKSAENNDAETSEADATPGSTELRALQRQSDDISGIMAGLMANPLPAEPPNTTGFTIRGNQPQNP